MAIDFNRWNEEFGGDEALKELAEANQRNAEFT